MYSDAGDALGGHDTSPWPAFADLLAATTLLFLILFAVVALPALQRGKSAQAKATTLRDLSDALTPEANRTKKFQVATVGDYLLIRIPEKATFPQGLSSISSFQPEGLAILRLIAARIRSERLLDKIDQIQVVGNTSSEGGDARNWQLSSSRATSVALILIDSLGIPACRVTALGRGRYYPVNPALARTTTIENPADRRIELEIRPVVEGDVLQKAQRDRCVEHPGRPEQ